MPRSGGDEVGLDLLTFRQRPKGFGSVELGLKGNRKGPVSCFFGDHRSPLLGTCLLT